MPTTRWLHFQYIFKSDYICLFETSHGHTEKSCIVSYYRQFSTKNIIKIITLRPEIIFVIF